MTNNKKNILFDSLLSFIQFTFPVNFFLNCKEDILKI